MEKILLLSNNENVKGLYNWLRNKGFKVTLWTDKISVDFLRENAPDFVISYNYSHIVKEDVIDMVQDRIINLHVSYLPWNKGASPNLWSFIDNTPKGVTIHRLEKGLDTGKIILQKELFFDESVETLASTYRILNEEIVKLLEDNWELFENGNYELKEQMSGGTYHRKADLTALLEGKEPDYSMTVSDFKKLIARQKEVPNLLLNSVKR